MEPEEVVWVYAGVFVAQMVMHLGVLEFPGIQQQELEPWKIIPVVDHYHQTCPVIIW